MAVLTSCADAAKPTRPHASASTAPPLPIQSTFATPTPFPTPSPTAAFLPAAGLQCTAQQLEVSLIDPAFAGAGSDASMVVFTDRGAMPCVLRGTPQVRFLDSKGETSNVSVVYSSHGPFPVWPNDGVGLIPLSAQPPPRGVRGQAGLLLQSASFLCRTDAVSVAVTLPSGELIASFGRPMGQFTTDCLPPSITVNPFEPAEAYR